MVANDPAAVKMANDHLRHGQATFAPLSTATSAAKQTRNTTLDNCVFRDLWRISASDLIVRALEKPLRCCAI